MPPYAWLAQHRVQRSRRLLRAGLRPAEVAGLVGFADQAHLTRWFRRVVGVTTCRLPQQRSRQALPPSVIVVG